MGGFSVGEAHDRAKESLGHGMPMYTWYVVLLLALINAVNYMDRMVLSVLSPQIKRDLDLSDAQLGLLVGFAFSVFYAICGIPVARWADRGSRRNIITIALATWSGMTALSGAAQNFWHLFLTRVGVGAGEAGCFPTAGSLLCDYIPFQRRAGIYALLNVGLAVGLMIGVGLGGWLGDAIGWRMTFVALGIPGITLAMIVRLTLREPTRGVLDGKPAASVAATGQPSIGSTVTTLWGCRTYRLLVLFFVATGFVNFGLAQWWPSLYERVSGLSMSSIGVYLGGAIGAGSMVGLLTGGWLADRVGRKDARLPLIYGAATTSCAIPSAIGSLYVSSVHGSMVLVALSVLLWSVPLGAAMAAMYSVTAARIRATAGAIATFLASILGAGLGPLCVGLLSDALAPLHGAEGLRHALLAPIAVLPVTVIALAAAARHLLADLVDSAGPNDDGEIAATRAIRAVAAR